MAQTLGSVAVGSIVKIKENGSPVEFYVAKHDYESGLNGAGRTLVVRKDTYDDRVWDSGNVNAYASSNLDSWFNSTYKNMLDADILSLIGTTKIRYTPGNGNNTVTTLERAIFALSLTELGQSSPYANTEGSALPIASTLQIAYHNGSATTQWTRSPSTSSTSSAWRLGSDGVILNNYCHGSFGSRPVFTLPGASVYVDDNNNVITNQPPTAPETITVPGAGSKGGSLTVSWTASTDPDGNLSGYTLQRSANGGGFTQVYQGASTSYTDTAPTNADTLQYRVQAYDTQGETSGWTTSDQIPVYGVPTLTVPQMVMQGQQATISWTAVEGADSYTLQRKANTDADWTQVYSGAAITFSETVGSWTSVQYRVQAVFSGTAGGWATSAAISVVSASALVISGTDGDLGTVTNDIPYTISTDTGNQITATVTVNSAVIFSGNVGNSTSDTIPVLDLVNGEGTIVIEASVTSGSAPVSAVRTWTYTKTAITFPNAGSVAQLIQQGANIWPNTIAEAVRAPNVWGGNLGLALNKLTRSVLYNRSQVAQYTEVTVSLAGKSEGDVIQLPEGGRMVYFYVAKLDYESGLNGTGRVLLVRRDCFDDLVWDRGNVNAYATSDIDAWFNGTYKALFPPEVQTAMGTTTFYYTPGNGNNTVTTLERSVFALSATELGQSNTYANTEGSALPIASTLRIAYRNGSPTTQWTRSPHTNYTSSAWRLYTNGSISSSGCDHSQGSRPAFTLPATFSYGPVLVANDGTIHDEQEYEEAGNFCDIFGGTIPVPRIETGSYVGTGTYGASNPTTLSFPFEPKMVIIAANAYQGGITHPLIRPDTVGYVTIAASIYSTMVVSWAGKEISFYDANSAIRQFNNSGTTYYYIALG